MDHSSSTSTLRLPTGWKTVTVGDVVVDAQSGFASGERDDNGILQLRMNNIDTAGHVVLDTYLKVPVPKDIGRYILKPKDVLFNNTNSVDLIGKTALFQGECDYCTYSNHITRLRVDDSQVTSEWLTLCLMKKWQHRYFARICARHVGQAGIRNEELLKTEIPLPPLSEIQCIAPIIITVDNAIQKSKVATEETERLKQGAMRGLLTKGIGHTEFKKGGSHGVAPKEWNIVYLSQISKIRYGLGQPPEKDDNGVPMIRATDIDRGNVDMRNALKIKRDRIPNGRSPYLKPGEIIVVRSGVNTGDLALYLPEYGEAIAGYDLVISPERETVDPRFLTYYLLGDAAQTYFKKQSARAAQPHLNSEQLGALKVPAPQMSEQKKIATILSTIDRKIDLQHQRTATLKRLQQGLMNDLLTGRRRVVTA